MKLALVIYGTLDTLSGGYLYDRKLVAYLRAHAHEVAVIAQPWRDYARHLRQNWHSEWQRALLDFAPDLILQDELNHPSLAFANARLRQRSPVPIVSIVHHLRSSEDHPAYLMPLYRAVERRYLASVDGFIWNSKSTCHAVEELLGRSATGIVAYPGAGEVASTDFLSLHEALPIATEPLARVLFVGNIVPRKRLDLVLDALKQTPALLTLDVVGSAESDPHYAAAMQQRARALGIGDRVHFHGRVNTEALRDFYRHAQLLIVPSFEGFGIVYLEAMAFGVPSIASNQGAAHELITHGENGFLVPPNAAQGIAHHLTTLTRDPALLATLRDQARRRFSTFPTWEETCHNIMVWLEHFVVERIP